MPSPLSDSTRRYVVGITGASGAVYAQKLISTLVRGGHEVHVACTSYGLRLLHDELGMEAGLNLNLLAGLPEGADPRAHRLYAHPSKDVGASIASGSFRHDGMVIMPCSSNTLGAVANGMGDTLVTRAAACALKERPPLIVCHREMPRSVDDLVTFVVWRMLDLLEVEPDLDVRWEQHAPGARRERSCGA